MSKNLIIVESPSKIHSYKKVLGNEYDIMASVGHCVDLPEKELGIDIKNDFSPTFVVKADHASVVNQLKSAAKKAEKIFLMTDEDREGEAIAWHLANQFDGSKAQILRATTNEITAKGITKALSSPGQLDNRKIDAYLARRLLDRLCGYKTSFLTQSATGGRSAGRVQSAILRIIVDRELEILHFVPVEYWVLTAYLLSSKGEAYTGVLTDKIAVHNEAEATKIYNAVIKGNPQVMSVESKLIAANPYPPFTTLPMIAAANTILGFPAQKTMKVAQSLYEAGHITYMRTDSPFMAAEAVQAVRSHIGNAYGNKYLPPAPRVYTAKKGAQEAHECCRPTNFSAHPSLDDDENKLYEMIWRRAVASQMTSGQDERTKIITQIAGYDFHTNGSVVVFDGHRHCWTYTHSKDVVLPKLFEGEKCTLKNLEKEQKFTKPPDRYTDASLSKKCEEEQITRPATFASFIETLKNRDYITQKKSITATELGIKVVQFLKDADICFVDIKFTAEMEKLLDEIQEATKEKSAVLKDFWERLKSDIERGKGIKKQAEVSGFKCPQCGGDLLKKFSKFGSFYACSNYKPAKKSKDGKEAKPEGCAYTAKVGDDGKPIEKVNKPKEYASFPCKKCGGKMVKRSSSHGEFYGCGAFPKCKTIADLNGVFKESSGKKYSKKYNKKKSSDEE